MTGVKERIEEEFAGMATSSSKKRRARNDRFLDEGPNNRARLDEF